MSQNIPFPEDDYLVALGRMTYAIGYLEGLILGDMAKMTALPPALDVGKLASKTVHQIGTALERSLADVIDPSQRAWLKDCGDYLLSLSERRNGVLHARAASTPDGRQRLYRWTSKPGQQFIVTRELLEALTGDIEDAVRDLAATRVA